jgi:flagellar basal body-associated protein FliL
MAETESAPSSSGSSRLATTLQALNTLLLAAVLGLTLRSMTTKAKEPTSAHAPTESAATEAGAKTEGGHGEAAAEGEHKADGAKEGEHESAKEGGEHGAAAPKSPTVKLADFVVQLRDTDADRYAKFSFELEMRTEADVAALTPALPRIRETFIAYLSDRTLEELRGSEGLNRAKRELLERVDATLPGKRVKNVFISDFVSQ